MKRIMLLATVLLIAFYFVPVAVTGSVYVVTSGMATVPMPLTKVNVYDAAEFNKTLGTKKLEYIKNCNQLPAPGEMTQLELNAIKDGPQAINEFFEYRKLVTACSTASFLSSAENLSPLQTVTTNKDGEFELKVKRFDKIVLVADGKRAVASGEETYTWLSRLETTFLMLSSTIELSNENEISTTKIVDVIL